MSGTNANISNVIGQLNAKAMQMPTPRFAKFINAKPSLTPVALFIENIFDSYFFDYLIEIEILYYSLNGSCFDSQFGGQNTNIIVFIVKPLKCKLLCKKILLHDFEFVHLKIPSNFLSEHCLES